MKHLAIAILALLFAVGPAHAGSPLADAIQAKDRAKALELLSGDADVNAAQIDGATPLIWAVHNVDVDLTRRLLEHGAEADVITEYGASPLAEAASLGHVEMVKMLLDAGADPDSANQDGQTALMLAARIGVTEMARLLVEHGADVNAVEQLRGQTALMWAAGRNHPEIVNLLLANGADVTVRAKANDWASQITSEPRAQYRQTGGLTALLYAVRQGCFDCAVAIAEAGADINTPSPDGITPLVMAIDNFSYDIAKYLLQAGADPHRWDWWGRTPLYAAVDMSSYRPGRGGFNPEGPEPGRPQNTDAETTPLEIVRMLLDADVDPNPQLNLWRPGRNGGGRFVDDSLTVGTTPLFVAAISYDNDAVRTLLAAGADPNIPNVMGNTPLMGAAGMGVSTRDSRGNFLGDVQPRAIETLKILLDAGADINARLTDTASRTGRIARASSVTDKQGQTALFAAASWGWTDVVRFLLDNGADPEAVDDLGKTAIDAARNQAGGRERQVSEEIVAILKKAGAGESFKEAGAAGDEAEQG